MEARQADAPNADAILLVNLGTPQAPTARALRRYLREFLSDPRVVELPRWLWLPILYGIVLVTRPAKSAKKYAAIWTAEGSPLRVHAERQTKLLKGLLGESGRQDVQVDYAMRYGQPAIGSALDRLQAAGASRITVVPLYPQYAASSTASVFDAVADWMKTARDLPELRLVRGFADHPGYIDALAASVRQHWLAHGRADRLVMSFHGIPQRSVERGDPYHAECRSTAKLLGEALQLAPDAYLVTFQSRFGAARWLQPYTQPTLEQLARTGTQSVDVICPGFVADCLETLEEIGVEGKTAFLTAGGEEFRLIPCLNERADWIAALLEISV